MTLNRGSKYKFAIASVEAVAEVSPCCWMYEGYGLQLSVSLVTGGMVFVRDKSVQMANATIADVNRLLTPIKLIPCKTCGTLTFDPTTVETNRKGLCEKCFLEELEVKWQKEQAKEDQKLQAQDKKMKAKGSTHRVTAWVHPSRGDDYQVDIYWPREPKPETIEAKLKGLKSQITNDYSVVVL